MLMPTNRRNAFTLLELLVVITIIAILAGVLAGNYGQVRENGWSTSCKGHLKNLYQAALNYSVDNRGGYPHAGPYETHDDLNNTYAEQKAWVNWTGTGIWPAGPNHMIPPTWYGSLAWTSITNGTLWDYTSHDSSAYFCPKFRSLKNGYDVKRSYVMNGYFGCQNTQTNQDSLSVDPRATEASRTLMFADMQDRINYPGRTSAGNMPVVCTVCAVGSTPPGPGDDGVLEATSLLSPYVTYESIGYIHRMAGDYYGHVVFMDGHIEAVGLKQADGSLSNRTFDACSGQY